MRDRFLWLAMSAGAVPVLFAAAARAQDSADAGTSVAADADRGDGAEPEESWRSRLSAGGAPRSDRGQRGTRGHARRDGRGRRRTGDRAGGTRLRRSSGRGGPAVDVRARQEERRAGARDRAPRAPVPAPAGPGRISCAVDTCRGVTDRAGAAPTAPGPAPSPATPPSTSTPATPPTAVAQTGESTVVLGRRPISAASSFVGARSRLLAAPDRLGAGHPARHARSRHGAALGRRQGQPVLPARLRRRPRHRHRAVDRRHSDQHGLARARSGLRRHELHHPRGRRARRDHQGPVLRRARATSRRPAR